MRTIHYKTLKGFMRANDIRQFTLEDFRSGRIYRSGKGWIKFTLSEEATNEYVWWADIYKCDILIATACVVLPIAVSTTMVFYKDGKPNEEFSIYQGSRPSGWEQDDFFKDAVSILNESYPLIPWMPNKAGMFHTK